MSSERTFTALGSAYRPSAPRSWPPSLLDRTDAAGKVYPTLLELAKRSGLATGNVPTSEIQDGTPAVQVSHISRRRCYGQLATTARCPEAAEETMGRGSISEQLRDTRPDVRLGGGVGHVLRDRHTWAAGRHDARAAGEGSWLQLLDREE